MPTNTQLLEDLRLELAHLEDEWDKADDHGEPTRPITQKIVSVKAKIAQVELDIAHEEQLGIL